MAKRLRAKRLRALTDRMSALTESIASYEGHLKRFLRLTALRAIQWINMNHHTIQFKAILE